MKILLIEDDLLFAEMIKTALQHAGHQVTYVGDGAEGSLTAQQEKYDLIVTDIFMPDKEGIEVIHEIRQTQPDIRIIAISSDLVAGHSSLLNVAKASGANAILRKPFSASQLLEKIDELASPTSVHDKKKTNL